MKGTRYHILSGLLAMFLIAGCAKQPAQEMNAARSAVDAAISEGAEKYSPAEAKRVDQELAAAMGEVKAQDDKFLKDYKKSREMLLKVKADADAMKAGLDAKKEVAKKNAVAAFEEAKSAVNAANSAFAKTATAQAAEGMEKITTDLARLDESLTEVKKLIHAEDYLIAYDKAEALKQKAADVSDEILGTAKKTPKKQVRG